MLLILSSQQIFTIVPTEFHVLHRTVPVDGIKQLIIVFIKTVFSTGFYFEIQDVCCSC